MTRGGRSAHDPVAASVGRDGFVAHHGLWTEDQEALAGEIISRARSEGLDVVRFAWADVHGVLRGKSMMIDGFEQALRNGCALTTTLLAKDTSHRTAFPVWQEGGGFDLSQMEGAGDMLMVADPATFRILPWAPGTGWVLCDVYFPDGTPVEFSTRRILAEALERLGAAGYDYLSGLEVEFHILSLDDPKLSAEHATQPATAPEVGIIHHGFQYLTETRLDEIDPLMEILRRQLTALGLPLRSFELEFGPSQVELTFHPRVGLGTADDMVLLRAAVRQICRREGYHASFMCRPNLPNMFSSGWHLHQSLDDHARGTNAFMPTDEGEALSPTGLRFTAGILEHAAASCVFTTPTINGYKRYRPFTLAPDRVAWGVDNKGTMLRAVGGPGDRGTRIENRVGEPAANPYLYIASQIITGLHGIERELEAPLPTSDPYGGDADRLPGSLIDALTALDGDELYRRVLGDRFIEYLLTIKRAEVSRFLSDVTDWEQREYFSMF